MPTSSNVKPLLIRLPDMLKQKLRARAKSNHRNMTGEVVALIEAATSEIECFEKKEDK
jgi:plasmid stability protein